MYLQNSNSNSVCLAKKATSTRRKLIVSLGLILSVLMMLVSFFVINNPMTARAESTTTPATVTVGELWNSETESFDSSNLAILQRYIYGGEDVRPSYIEEMAKAGLDRTELNAKTLPAGFYKDTAYSAKSSTQDIVVTLHGYEWYLTSLYFNDYSEYFESEEFNCSILELTPVQSTAIAEVSEMPEFTDKHHIFGLYIDYNDYDLSTAKVSFNLTNANKNTYRLTNAVLEQSISESTTEIITINSERLIPDLDYKVDSTITGDESAGLVVSGSGMYADSSEEDIIVRPKAAVSLVGTFTWTGDTPYSYSGSWTSGSGIYNDQSQTFTVKIKMKSNYALCTTSYSAEDAKTYSSTVYCYMSTSEDMTAGCGSVKYTMAACSLSGCTVTLNKSTTQYYTGSSIWVAISSVKYGSYTIGSGNYTRSGTYYATSVGTYTYKVIPNGSNMSGEWSTTWSIVGYKLSSISSPSAVFYTGSAQTPSPTVKYSSTTLTKGTHYTLSYSNNTGSRTSNQTATVTATGKAPYYGTVSATWTIKYHTISSVNLDSTSKTYNGASQSVSAVNATCSCGTIYSGWSTNGGTYSATNAGTYYVYFKDNTSSTHYMSSSKTTSWKINTLPVSSCTITLSSNPTYTGSTVSVSISSIKYGSNSVTTATITNNSATNAGSYTATITGSGNLSGTTTKSWSVSKASMSSCTITMSSKTYNGSSQSASVSSVKLSGNTISSSNYTISGTTSATNAGTYSVTFTGSTNLTGTASVSWTMSGCSTWTVSLSATSYTFNGAAQGPSVTVKIGSTTIGSGNYSVSGNSNTAKGSYIVSVTGGANLASTTKTASYTINVYNDDLTVTLNSSSFTYSRSAHKPTVSSIKIGTTTVGSSYYSCSYTYSNNTDAGTGTVSIAISGSISKTVSKNFTINPKPLSDSDISMATVDAQTYTGSAIKPTPAVKHGSTSLSSSTEFTYSYSGNTNCGANGATNSATITATGKGNYTSSKSVTFTINKRALTACTITLGTCSNSNCNSTSHTYLVTSGVEQAHTPAVTLKYSSTTLSANYYSVSYSSNTNAGTATVTITPKTTSSITNLSGSTSTTFTISKRTMSSATVAAIDNQTYTGAALTPGLTVTYNGKSLTKDTHFTLSYSNNVNAGTDTASATLTAKSSNFTGTKTVNFSILARPLDNSNFKISTADASKVYTRSSLTSTVTLKYGSNTIPTNYYSVSWSSNTNVGRPTVTIKAIAGSDGITNLSGTATYSGSSSSAAGYQPFTITARPLSDSAISMDAVTAQTYTGAAIKPTPAVKHGSTSLSSSTEFTYSYSNNTNCGANGAANSATITATGKGNYSGTRSVTFTINKRALSECTITLGTCTNANCNSTSHTYLVVSGTVQSHTPAVTLKYGSNTLSTSYYSVSYSNNTNAGTATVTINPKTTSSITNLSGSTSTTFTIATRSITAATIATIAAQTYTGAAIKPTPAVSYNSKALTSGTDFTYSYNNNTNCGAGGAANSATVTITGKGNYSSSKSTTFTINKRALSECTITLGTCTNANCNSTSHTYLVTSGVAQAHTPAVTLKYGSTTLSTNYYSVGYTDNTNAGTEATVTITPKTTSNITNLSGSKTAKFTISARAISAATKSGFGTCNYTGSTGHSRCTASTCYYNTHAHQRTQTLTYNSMTLGTSDYSYAFTDNILKGTATITYTGKGNYTGTTSATWEISAMSVANVVFTYATDYTYNGSKQGPTSFTAYLQSGCSCSISTSTGYSYAHNATNAGTYAITFTGSENLTGTKNSDKFTIKQKSIADNDTVDGTTSVAKAALSSCQGYDSSKGTGGHYLCSSAACTYNTHAHIRNQALTYNNMTLNDSDRTIAYSNNILKGTATVTYTGKGNYKGTVSRTWTINALDMSKVTFSYDSDSYVYTTRAIGPSSFVGYLTSSTCCTIQQSGPNGGYTWSGNTAVDAGTHYITFTGTGNLTGTKNTDAYVIAPRPVSDSDVIVTIDPLYQLYKHGENITDNEFKNVLTLAYDVDSPMALNTDYTFVLSNKSAIYEDTTFADPNPPTVTITGKGNYTGTTTRNFLIYDNNLNQNECSILLPYTEHVYTGHGIEPIVTVHWKGTHYHTGVSVDKNLTRNTDYTITYTNNVNVGTATITITGINDYNGTVIRTFKITQADISYIPQSQITLSQDTYTYTGVANTPTPTVKYQHSNLCTAVCGKNICSTMCYNNCSDDAIKTLANNTDYTYTIVDNINAGVALVTITGIGNYKGTNHTNFRINPQNMTSVVITGLDSDGYKYTGSAITPEFTATYTRSEGATPETLVYRKDFSISYEDNVEAGTATLILTGIGNFTGEQTATFKIIALPVDIEDGRLSIEPIGSFVYTGADIEPEIHMTFNTKPLSLGADYEVAYTNNKNVGTATATITGVGNFAGTSITKTFEITKKNITELSYAHNFGSRELHTGNNITPEVTLSYNGTALKKGTDFNVTYENNRDIGQGTIKITGINNFDGNLTGNFTIFSYDMDKLEATVDTSLSSYRGKNVAVMPPITLNDPLAKFTVTYENNYQAGTATATIVGTDGYTGTIVKQFTITEANINTESVKATAADAYFTDSEYNPDLRLEFTALNAEGTDTQTTVLEAGEDFRVTGIEVDTVNFRGVATIEGIKNFVGTRQVEFNIVARDISTATVNTLGDVTYTGEEIKPEITLKYEGTDLVEGDDYVLEYYDNINAGTAYVDVIGMGKFGGIRTLSFTIKQVKLTVNPTYNGCDVYYEYDSLPQLFDESVAEYGRFEWVPPYFLEGENDYIWYFIPNDTVNYETISGEETFTAIDVYVERIITELTGDVDYYAYDSTFDRSGIQVTVHYSNDRYQILDDDQYSISLSEGEYLQAGEELTVYVNEGDIVVGQGMGFAIQARPVTVTFDGYSNLTETDGNQTISVSVDGLLEGYENVYSIVYYNLSNDTIGNSITTAGSYRVEVILSDNNYAITGASSVTFNVKTTALSNDTVSITSTDGFEGGASVDLKTYATEEELVSAYNLGNIDFGGKYLRAYSFDVVSQGIAISNNDTNTAKTVTVKLSADGIETTDNLKLYAVRQGALVALDYTVVDGKFVFDCELTDVVVFVEEMEEKSFNWAILVWSLVGLLVVGAVIGTVLYFDIRNKKANSNTSSKKTAKKSTK